MRVWQLLTFSKPDKPTVLGLWKSREKLGGSAVVVADARHAYLGAMKHGLIVLDITRPQRLRQVAIHQPDINFPRPKPGAVQHPNARGMTLRGTTLYLTYDAGGLRILDVSRPQTPREIGRYVNAVMGKKPQAFNNIVVAGKLAYVATDYAGMEILDISNPRKPVGVSWWNPWRAQTLSNNWFNSPGHVNQLIFDAGKKEVYLSAGDSELLVLDVSRPARPRQIAAYGTPKNKQGVWGLGGDAEHIYLGYITTIIPFRGTWSGIRAIKRP